MRRVRYAVACSLDGFIAGTGGEADWIIVDPDIDFEAIWGAFDTLLIGRNTLEEMGKAGQGSMPGVESIVFSRTLDPEDYRNVKLTTHRIYEKTGIVSLEYSIV